MNDALDGGVDKKLFITFIARESDEVTGKTSLVLFVVSWLGGVVGNSGLGGVGNRL